ncbi:hypothetical protein PHLGIDRAFT_188976 [Phlebiopsis gigantea 11061_1 CR5-6]|uniref:F-box domain-containing protein n=1 Tax=Phlebiopsis gigantea (strain 11061_1 CR5-6) TaxID=745531 RepID=A0A0C3S3U5_PHLG1|nr:hypothetical protein PHLGIDRAFT_188976 [Phlebiopsis gigantea 11061_1 CR5-6]
MPNKRKPNNTDATLAAKRARRCRGSRGRLEGMPEMPLDILFIIFGQLMPMDLLNIARTAKVFRRFLMARSAAPLWRAARRNADGLPDCPPLLSEPAYANLVFDTHCHHCQKANVKTVFWELNARFCPACRKFMLDKCRLPVDICCCRRDETLSVIAPYCSDSSLSFHWHRVDDPPAKYHRKYNALDDQGKQTHREQMHAFIKPIEQWASDCGNWQEEQAHKRVMELRDIRRNRLDAIVEKLRDLGWGDELNQAFPTFFALRWHSSVNQSRPLTDRIWNNIRDDLVKLMESQRNSRLEQLRLRCLTQRCSTFQRVYRAWHAKQPKKHVLPRAIDLMRRPEVRAVIEQDNEQFVADGDFEVFADNFADWSVEWKAECDEKLRGLIRASEAFKDNIPEDVDPLSLASVVFTCRGCSSYTSSPKRIKMPPLYPTTLTHDCLYPQKHEYSIKDPFERAAVAASETISAHRNLNMRKHTFWSCDSLLLEKRWSERMEKIITAFKKDPKSATMKEMDTVDDIRVCCFQCPMNTPLVQDVMNWRHAIKHYVLHDILKGTVMPDLSADDSEACPLLLRNDPVLTLFVEKDVLQQVLQKEADDRSLLADENEMLISNAWYNCSHCPRGGLSNADLIQHVAQCHSIELPGEEDFYRSPDAEMSIMGPGILVHRALKEFTLSEIIEGDVDDRRIIWVDIEVLKSIRAPNGDVVSANTIHDTLGDEVNVEVDGSRESSHLL